MDGHDTTSQKRTRWGNMDRLFKLHFSVLSGLRNCWRWFGTTQGANRPISFEVGSSRSALWFGVLFSSLTSCYFWDMQAHNRCFIDVRHAPSVRSTIWTVFEGLRVPKCRLRCGNACMCACMHVCWGHDKFFRSNSCSCGWTRGKKRSSVAVVVIVVVGVVGGIVSNRKWFHEKKVSRTKLVREVITSWKPCCAKKKFMRKRVRRTLF